MGLRLKTAVFSVVFKSRRYQDQKNSFQCGFQMWEEPRPKTMVFSQNLVFSAVFKCGRSQDQKLQFLAKNHSFQCSFQLKTVVFSAVFKCGRSQGQNHSFQCGFQMWEEPRPKTVVFGQKLRFLAPKTKVFKSGRSPVKNHSFWPKTSFQCGFELWGGAKV